jgi:energy-coupling factor transporter ATP-binding protein EcfA2
MAEKSIIALCGPAGSGKSTLADLLIEHEGYMRLSFAAPIKAMLKTLLRLQGVEDRLINQMLFGDLKEEPSEFLSNKSPRHCMQTLGTEWRNTIDLNLWTNIWRRSAEFVTKIVIDDLRFIHESTTIKELGGTIILIVRPGLEVEALHQSEREYMMIKQDRTLINNANPINMLQAISSWGIL